MRRRRPKPPEHYPHHNDDTAPFDVAAFLQYLHEADTASGRTDPNLYRRNEDPALPYNDNSRYGSTHYYGDECPGGHYATAGIDYDDNDLEAHNDYLDNVGTHHYNDGRPDR